LKRELFYGYLVYNSLKCAYKKPIDDILIKVVPDNKIFANTVFTDIWFISLCCAYERLLARCKQNFSKYLYIVHSF